MNKVVASPAEAVADVPDGAHVAISGFGLTHSFPSSLILALADQGAKDLTVYCNGLGASGYPTAQTLAENHQISHLVASFSARPGPVTAAEQQILSGDMDFEAVPQGILVERMRAGGAGIPAFYSPVGVGTAIAEGKDVGRFDGREFVLERGITTDYALLRARRADTSGNVQFHGGSRNFNDSFAKAARIAIVEVEEIVEVGRIPPEQVDLAGIWISRVVRTTTRVDPKTIPRRSARGGDSRRVYDGKAGLSRSEIGRRAARLLADGGVVNLGAGLPNHIAEWIAGRGITLHAENGILGYRNLVPLEDADPDIHDAGGNFVDLAPGASLFDSVTSFEIARGKRLDAVVLGAFQVDSAGSLANWAQPGRPGGGIGGAMDLAVGANSVIVTMEHLDAHGRPKLVDDLEYPVTARGCVDAVVTDLALLRRDRNALEGGFVLEEVARGFTVDDIRARTPMYFSVPCEPRVMQENW